MEIFAGAFRTLPNYTGTSDVGLHSMGKPSPLPVHGWRDQDRGGRGKRDTGDRILGERRNSIGFLFLSPLAVGRSVGRSRYQMQIQLQLPSSATSHHIRGRKERRNEDILHIFKVFA